MATNRVPELDFLRFAAAASVVLYHNTYRLPVHGVPSEDIMRPVQAVSRFGYLGVSLFFLISGFVILWSAEGKTSRGFIASRALRLYPSFWAALGITVLAVALLDPSSQLSAVDLIKNLTMVPGQLGAESADGVYWTLAVEIKFYFIVLLLLLFRQMQRIEAWLWMWLVGLVICQAGLSVPGLASVTMFPFGSLFVGGCWAYHMHSRGVSRSRMAGFIVALVLAVLAVAPDAASFMHNPSRADVIVAQIMVASCYLLILAVALHWWRTRWSAAAIFLGALTYPLYLVHNRIGKLIYAATEDHLPLILRVLVITAIAVVLAWGLTEIVEKRVVRFLANTRMFRWFSGRRTSGVVPGPETSTS